MEYKNDLNFLEGSNQSQVSTENNDQNVGKPYKAPVLTKYGSIAELVLSNGGVGNDGSGFPPASLT